MALAAAVVSACGTGPVAWQPSGGSPSATTTLRAADRAETLRALIDSAAMGGRWPAIVILPPAYRAEPARRFPVIYLLHGAGGDHRSWLRSSDIARMLETRPVICVCVCGRTYGWYVDSPVRPDSQVQMHVTRELVQFVDANFRTVARREGRALCGYSMGGHGAITLAAKRPDLFSSASSLAGIMDIARWPDNWRIAAALGPLEANRGLWKSHSAMGLAGTFADGARGARIMIDCGVDDFAYPENREFHALLERLGVRHAYRERPGGHDWRFWTTHLAEHIDFHLESFRMAGVAGPAQDG